ncbi:unnamed protein product [Gongylonema pulchrum]|uniref:HA2 domain-containing protein n=1 Tax=Gongylonema pulchrum TaxID=637853 RepID=A0A183E4R5_9BILA|nr:unnamed protein product [Gongylonema pulchrum]
MSHPGARFAMDARNTQSTDQRQKRYVSELPDRPQSFEPRCVQLLKRTRLDTVYLVDTYMMDGGEQWVDGVDTDLTTAVISYCMDSSIDGSILVFLPGYDDIVTVREKARQMRGCVTRPSIFMLHSQMSSRDQQRVFEPVGPGYRKVLPEMKRSAIHEVCLHAKMFAPGKTSVRQFLLNAPEPPTAEAIDRSLEFLELPEMKRSAIHEVCLHAKMFAPGKTSVRQFLLNAPEPPTAEAIDRSLEFLEQIDALLNARQESTTVVSSFDELYFSSSWERQEEPDLTDFGRHIAQLPLDPQLARLLLFGICLKCLSPVLTLVSALSHRDPFVLPPTGDRDERNAALNVRDHFAGSNYSDHMALLRAFNMFSNLPSYSQVEFCTLNYLSLNVMRMIAGIRQQLFGELQRLRLIPANCHGPEDYCLNRYSHSWPMIQGAIVAGSYPGIGFNPSGGSTIRKIRTSSNEIAQLAYGCAVKRQVAAAANAGVEPSIQFLAFQEMSQTNDSFCVSVIFETLFNNI